MPLKLIFASVIISLAIGCSTLGKIDPSKTLANDAVNMKADDLAGPGTQEVTSTRMNITHQGETITITLYQPIRAELHSAAIVFLPGRMATDDQYESYARALASRGFIVAVHAWYSLFTTDLELAHEAQVMANWLLTTFDVDANKIGIAGHSMGGKDAVLAAATHAGLFNSVVAIDPDDNGEVSVVREYVAALSVPLLLIGAEVAWQAASICAPKKNNYLRFFEQAPAGTIELTLNAADHVQMLDDPDRFGYGICRSGTADSKQVRITSRRATVGFFVQHMMSGPVLAIPHPHDGLIRVAEDNQIKTK